MFKHGGLKRVLELLTAIIVLVLDAIPFQNGPVRMLSSRVLNLYSGGYFAEYFKFFLFRTSTVFPDSKFVLLGNSG